jgi:PBP1b-binding outer membrane lipoprotein LpoB
MSIRARRIAALAVLLAAVLGGCTQNSSVVPNPDTPTLPVEDGGGGY